MSVLLLLLTIVVLVKKVLMSEVPLPSVVKQVDPDYSDPLVDINARVKEAKLGQMQMGDQPGDQYFIKNKNISMAESQTRARLWFDFVANHDRNLQKPPEDDEQPRSIVIKDRYGKRIQAVASTQSTLPREDASKAKYFRSDSFGMDKEEPEEINYTTCDELKRLNGSVFNPNDIVELNWDAFYAWSEDPVVFIKFRFMPATVKLVQYYYEKFSLYINRSIDWSQPKLYLKQPDNEMLLIAADRSGLYHCLYDFIVPQYVIDNNITMPTITVRFKIMDPYLVVMFCGAERIILLALEGEAPKTEKEIADEVATLGIHGRGFIVEMNSTYLYRYVESLRLDEEEKKLRQYIYQDGMFPPHVKAQLENIWRRKSELWE